MLRLDYLNAPRKPFCLASRNDMPDIGWYHSDMAQPRHDWYFNEWLDYFGKSQADVYTALDWNKSKASLFASGQQRYHRDDLNGLAALLHLEPFELLLPPERAMAIRSLRASAEEIVKEVPEPTDMWAEKVARQTSDKPTRRKTGTDG